MNETISISGNKEVVAAHRERIKELGDQLAAKDAEIARLMAILSEIAGQPLDTELPDDGPWGSDHDFVEKYDGCVRTARSAFETSGGMK